MKRKAPHGTAKLCILIKGSVYALTNLHPGSMPSKAWRLRKITGKTYTVSVDEGRGHCTCADFIYAREKRGDTCKHLLAMKAVGLLDLAAPG